MSDRDYSNYWFEVSESDFPHEREGLAWIRDHLPAGFIAWSNFTFDADGVSNEVDCLIAGPTGVFHVELKSYKGALQIEGGSWRFRSSSGYKTIKGGNPRHLAEKKAKRLKSRLEQVSRRGNVPYITSLVFFHHATSDVSQAVELGEIGLVVSDGKSGSGPGLVETLRDPTIAGLRAPRNKYSKGQIADVNDRMQKIGIASRMASRSVGDYELQHLISSRDGSEDWIAIHRASDKDQDRVRCYPIPPACDEEKRRETGRRAKREWSLLRKLNHQNIETVLNYVPDGDRGPSLIYRGVPELILGDVFQKKIALNDEQIYSILRQLADAVSYAHSNGIYHRALSPESVSLHPRDDCFRVEVTRWLSAVDERNTTRHILPGDLELLGYRSMELLSDPGRSDPRVDIYSLGGIAFFLATGGHPPLSDAGRPLVTSKGLDAPDQLRDLSPELRRLIERSTAASEDRIRTVQDFVDLLDCFPKTQEEVPEAEQVVDPLQASPPASEIQFSNKRLLGSGSAGTAYLVNNADGEFVLKVANDPSCDYLLEQEADALRSISSPRVVQLHKDLKYEQRSAVLIDVAGKILLGELLRKSDLTTEQRQELILELLELAVDLEAAGIVHGDLHPGHIGVHNPPGDLRVCAFDFSLRPSGSSLPASIEYSDPREVVDPLADRYSIAAMCYQLYTGSLFTRTGLQTPNDTIASVLMDAMHEFVENRPASARAMRDEYREAFERKLQEEAERKLQEEACHLEDESASDFKMPIGKHKGKTLGEILEKHRGYLEWAVENIDDKPHITDKCKSLLAMSPSEPDQVHNGVDADPVRRWSLIDLKVTHPNPLRRSVPYDYTSGTRGSIRTMGGRCQRPYRCLISSPKLQTRLLRPVQQNIFCVVEKILTRGSFSPLSPNLESIVSRLVSEASTGDATTEAEIGCEFSFDSEHEADLYERFLKVWLSSDQMSCLISQVNIAGLTGNSADLPLGERVDFVLTDGEDVRVVVEVDGPQHVDDVSYDQTRDTRLQAAGWQVVRIPTSELKAGSGENLSFLRERCEACSPPTRLLLDDVFSRCLQVQLALLEVLRAKQPGDCLPVQIVWPEWEGIDAESLDAAVVDDFNQLTSQVAELYGSACTVVQHARHDPEVIVSFQGITDSMPEDCPTWTIRDIHIPGRYRARLRSATLQSELHPKRETVQSLVHRIYGFPSLREGQYEAIERGLAGKDSIVLLPTGAGKSVVFQTVCLLRSGVGLVISPLVSLMEDQIDNLHRHGITNCGLITGDRDRAQKNEFFERFGSGSLLLAYIAPERLQMEDFREHIRSLCSQSPVSCIAIDEAHCVSEWGHSFRTSYLNLAENCRNLCSHKAVVPPLFALTGTASRSVLMDVQRELSINDPSAVITPSTFDREELQFSVRRCDSDEKQLHLQSAIREVAERFGQEPEEFFEPIGDQSNCGLVFVPHANGKYGMSIASQTVSRATTQQCGMYASTKLRDVEETSWKAQKKAYASKFKNNELTFLAATSAFGMGVDKPNVRCTFHINLPQSIEGLYQEAGRAGRDGQPSICTIIYSDEEARANKVLIDPNTPIEDLVQLAQGGSGDDIRRMLWFHTGSFKGESLEQEETNMVIDHIGSLESPSKISLSYDGKEEKTTLEKAIHRLLTLSVVSDYTVEYSKEQIQVDVAGSSNDNVMRSLRSYMSNFDSRDARMKIQELASRAELPRPEFAKLASKTLTGFIYQHIEKSRRRSLIETLRLCEEGRTNESEFRKRLVEYLQTSKFSKQVDELCVSGPRDSSLDASDDQTDPGTLEKCAYVLGMIEDCGTPDDAGHLRGEAARALTSYPGNPHLLLLRALSECLVRSPSERSIQEDGDESVRVLSSMMAPDDLRKVLTDCSLAISNERPSSAHLFVEAVCRARPDDCQYLESLVLADNDLLSVIAAKTMLSSINGRISNLVSSEP